MTTVTAAELAHRCGISVTSARERLWRFEAGLMSKDKLLHLGPLRRSGKCSSDKGTPEWHALSDKPQWALVGDDLEPLAGASIVIAQNLQGGDSVTLLLLSERAIIKSYGYKRRSSTITYYEDGEAKAIPMVELDENNGIKIRSVRHQQHPLEAEPCAS